jgi:nitroimidazol reductase NimA-like FMN-containing flavoprotein (pyridoxamine 5'-phosphate oxidase superfamily)
MFAMSKTEREAFLSETRVAVISVGEAGRGPLTLPVWYRYEPGGDIYFVTAASSKKVALIRKAGRMSLCIQTEAPPYKYVSVEGPVVIAGEPDFERDVRGMAYRYLGNQMGELYLQMTAEEQARNPNVLVCLTPEHWLTVDYGKMVGQP